jgi:hypothetical protein
MNTDALTNPTVKAAIEALQKGDQQAHGKIERLDIGQA